MDTIETLAKIYTFLPIQERQRLGIVSRLWHAASIVSIDIVKLTGDQYDISNIIERHKHWAKTLQVDFSDKFDDQVLHNLMNDHECSIDKLIIRGCNRLQKLCFGNVEYRVTHLEVWHCRGIESAMPISNIQRLHVLDMTGSFVTNEFLEKSVASCPNLRALRAGFNRGLEELRLLRCGRFLEEIDLERCYSLRNFQLNCPSLTMLNVSRTALDDATLRILLRSEQTGAPLKENASYLPNLLKLKADRCMQLKNPVLQSESLQELSLVGTRQLAKPKLLLPSLLRLHIEDAPELQDTTVETILQRCSSLEEARFIKCKALKYPAVPCAAQRRLRTLDFSRCCSLQSIRFTETNGDSGSSILLLQDLRLDYTQIDDQALQVVLQRCKHSLQILSCRGVNTLVKASPKLTIDEFTCLKSIDFSGCLSLSAEDAQLKTTAACAKNKSQMATEQMAHVQLVNSLYKRII